MRRISSVSILSTAASVVYVFGLRFPQRFAKDLADVFPFPFPVHCKWRVLKNSQSICSSLVSIGYVALRESTINFCRKIFFFFTPFRSLQ